MTSSYLSADSNPRAICVEVSKEIGVPPHKLISIYLDYKNWNKLFPLTIMKTRLINQENGQQVVEVDHKKAGKVINLLSTLSKEDIRLEEFKPVYDAVFINRFEPMLEGSRYTVIGYIILKGIYRLAKPFAKGIIKKRMLRFVLEPMKDYAEKNSEVKIR